MKLYCLTDEGLFHRISPEEQVAAFLRGGAKIIQFRAKKFSDSKFLSCAKKIRAMTKKAGCLFIVNDRLEIACRVLADGVHLGQDDMKISEAQQFISYFFAHQDTFYNKVRQKRPIRQAVIPDGKGGRRGNRPLPIRNLCVYIGRSTHSLSQALQAVREGADYISIGPVFPTQTKPEYESVGLEVVRQVCQQVKIPIVAIGGINEANLQNVLKTGARIVAMITGITRTDSIEKKMKGVAHKLLLSGVTSWCFIC